ncbi:hypothetical protein [Actinoplanes sp. NPDC051494]|uniref:hypothetical protein n=1 Tax=Actinoplanes sp. NPDC051494 TaxID=3363907 RepID=UPI003795F200
MLAEVLLDTGMGVHYGFLTLCSAQTDATDDDRDAWRGQRNGLVGAATPEMLRIRTETHTGRIHVRIELHDTDPEVAGEWQEVVDVHYASWVDDLTLSAFDEWDGPVCLPPGSYHVRYSARTVPVDESEEAPVAEECLLQFWPATGTDVIVRQTTAPAAYRHRTGVEATWTAAELSARVEELRDNEETFEEPPSEERQPGWQYGHLVRSLGPAGRSVGGADAVLAAHLTTAAPSDLRAIAAWAIEQALTVTGTRDLPGIDGALAAVRRGDALPPAFADRSVLPPLHLAGERPEQIEAFKQAHLRHQAVEQLYQAAEPASVETTCAVLQATSVLTGGGLEWLTTAVRRVFPHLIPVGR